MIYRDDHGWFDNTPSVCKPMTAFGDFNGKPFLLDLWSAIFVSGIQW